MLPSGSLLAEPFKVTVIPEVAVWFDPAFAVGATFRLEFTVTLTVAAGLVAPRLSVTTSEKVSVVVVATVGAGKVGCEVVPLESVTVGVPAVWVHV